MGAYLTVSEHQSMVIRRKSLQQADLNVCLSCLVTIRIMNDEGQEVPDKGFVLDHSPAQMRDIRGLDPESLQYLHVLTERRSTSYSNTYAFPLIFLLGLFVLIYWLFYLNAKQQRLINQKNEFVNHLSHQFQTPLSSIKLSANLLAERSASNKNELVQIIRTESNRLENHIRTVFALG